MKRAADEREIANEEVQEILVDQRATQKILTSLLSTLKDFNEKAALVQHALDSISRQGVQGEGQLRRRDGHDERHH